MVVFVVVGVFYKSQRQHRSSKGHTDSLRLGVGGPRNVLKV